MDTVQISVTRAVHPSRSWPVLRPETSAYMYKHPGSISAIPALLHVAIGKLSALLTLRLDTEHWTCLQSLLQSIEDLLAAITGRLHSIILYGRILRPATQLPPGRPETSFIVWKAECTGCLISGGTIKLLPECILLLTGHGVHFSNTSFSGIVSRLSCCL